MKKIFSFSSILAGALGLIIILPGISNITLVQSEVFFSDELEKGDIVVWEVNSYDYSYQQEQVTKEKPNYLINSLITIELWQYKNFTGPQTIPVEAEGSTYQLELLEEPPVLENLLWPDIPENTFRLMLNSVEIDIWSLRNQSLETLGILFPSPFSIVDRLVTPTLATIVEDGNKLDRLAAVANLIGGDSLDRKPQDFFFQHGYFPEKIHLYGYFINDETFRMHSKSVMCPHYDRENRENPDIVCSRAEQYTIILRNKVSTYNRHTGILVQHTDFRSSEPIRGDNAVFNSFFNMTLQSHIKPNESDGDASFIRSPLILSWLIVIPVVRKAKIFQKYKNF